MRDRDVRSHTTREREWELDQHNRNQWILVPFPVLDQCEHFCIAPGPVSVVCCKWGEKAELLFEIRVNVPFTTSLLFQSELTMSAIMMMTRHSSEIEIEWIVKVEHFKNYTTRVKGTWPSFIIITSFSSWIVAVGRGTWFCRRYRPLCVYLVLCKALLMKTTNDISL